VHVKGRYLVTLMAAVATLLTAHTYRIKSFRSTADRSPE
jgi:hypothetical protein